MAPLLAAWGQFALTKVHSAMPTAPSCAIQGTSILLQTFCNSQKHEAVLHCALLVLHDTEFPAHMAHAPATVSQSIPRI